MIRPVPRSFRCMYAACVFAIVAIPGVRCSDDSLRSALEAISDKIGETPSRVVYLNPEDGQPEDIGYGYQKNLKNLENIFEQGTPSNANKFTKEEIVEKFLDYLGRESPRQPGRDPWRKKSIFRERGDSDVPDSDLQQLKFDRYAAPSAFRERYKTYPAIQDYKTGSGGGGMDADGGQDEYLYALNSLLDKYIEENVQGLSDEELEEYLRSQQEKRRDQPTYNDYYNHFYNQRAAALPRPVPAKRQYSVFVPRFHHQRQNTRKNHKYPSRWTKSRLAKRSEKNRRVSINESHTDPKVVAELNNIFLGSESNGSGASGNVTTASSTTTSVNDDKTFKSPPPPSGAEGPEIELRKKSIDWSNYFGYDRKKKSIENIPSDDTILNQYMRTYSKETEANSMNNLKDEKLMWLEDALIDDALKYTGANQGINDAEEINNVKNQVLANLNQAYNIEKLRQENNEMPSEKHYEKTDFVIPAENNSQPMNSLDTVGLHKEQEVDHKECTQLLQITQDCLELGGSAGDLMLPLCSLYRVCRTCESEQSECDEKFVQGSHELCSKGPLCRYFSRRLLQLMQDRPLQMECHKCMVEFLQNED